MTETTQNKDSSTQPALVVMAAGLGSRFGGTKQLAQVGQNGEAFLDFSIADAQEAGFGEVIMIVRSEIEEDVKSHVQGQQESAQKRAEDRGLEMSPLPVTYVRQDDLGPARDKPWGTVHAILSAAKAISGPFAVVNADDYYGPKSFVMAADLIAGLEPNSASIVAFELGNTVPAAGSVTRGVTQVVDGKLTEIVEMEECQRNADGTFSANGEIVPGSTPVSMNLWCFNQSILDKLQANWEAFLQENENDPKAEVQLPTAVGDFVDAGQLVVNVVSSPEQWIGITNPEDFETAKDALSSRQ